MNTILADENKPLFGADTNAETKNSVPQTVLDYIHELVNFHVVEENINGRQSEILESLWRAFVGGDLEKMRQVIVGCREHLQDLKNVLSYFFLDYKEIATDWGSTYHSENNHVVVYLMHSIPGVYSAMSRRQTGAKRYTLILSTNPDIPVKLYCNEKDDRIRSACDAASGYRTNLDEAFLPMQAMVIQGFSRLCQRAQEGRYSRYCNYTPKGWEQFKKIRDQERKLQQS